MTKTNDLRCSKCNTKFGEHSIQKGSISIQCRKSQCKHLNTFTFREGPAKDSIVKKQLEHVI